MKEKHIVPPCRKCPYKLGQVKCVVNPCPQCKQNGYSAYDRFVEGVSANKANR